MMMCKDEMLDKEDTLTIFYELKYKTYLFFFDKWQTTRFAPALRVTDSYIHMWTVIKQTNS